MLAQRLWPARALALTLLLIHTLRDIQGGNRSICDIFFVTEPFLAATMFGSGAFSRTFSFSCAFECGCNHEMRNFAKC
jgi:hypothetical protein